MKSLKADLIKLLLAAQKLLDEQEIPTENRKVYDAEHDEVIDIENIDRYQ